MEELDGIDKKLLYLLDLDSRAPVSQIAKKLR
ncbi:AsnC family transcriptional regulator, partial [Candidatus Micrarchaeota archaeon]|nr:AsnC family transcriptional regulator [Candidatus Micrarchaeota archaeon]